MVDQTVQAPRRQRQRPHRHVGGAGGSGTGGGTGGGSSGTHPGGNATAGSGGGGQGGYGTNGNTSGTGGNGALYSTGGLYTTTASASGTVASSTVIDGGGGGGGSGGGQQVVRLRHRELGWMWCRWGRRGSGHYLRQWRYRWRRIDGLRLSGVHRRLFWIANMDAFGRDSVPVQRRISDGLHIHFCHSERRWCCSRYYYHELGVSHWHNHKWKIGNRISVSRHNGRYILWSKWLWGDGKIVVIAGGGINSSCISVGLLSNLSSSVPSATVTASSNTVPTAPYSLGSSLTVPSGGYGIVGFSIGGTCTFPITWTSATADTTTNAGPEPNTLAFTQIAHMTASGTPTATPTGTCNYASWNMTAGAWQ